MVCAHNIKRNASKDWFLLRLLVNLQGGVGLDSLLLAELFVILTVYLGQDDVLSLDLLGSLLELGF